MDFVQLGRITDPNALNNIESIRIRGDEITVSGRIGVNSGYTVERMKVIRDQVLALGGRAADHDERYVPMVFHKDPTLTCMVEVEDVSANIGPGELDEAMAMGSTFSVTARMAGHQPNIESTLVGGYRGTTTVATSLPTPWHAVPTAALDYYDGIDTFQDVPAGTRTGEHGSVSIYRHGGFGAGGVGESTATFSVPAANWYDGAAAIEFLHAPGEWHTVIGRHLRPAPALMDKARSWRLTNGLVRIYPSATGGTFEVQAYSGGAWGTPKVLQFRAADGVGGYDFTRIHTVAVRRNSPEECKVRLTVGFWAGGIDYPQRVVLDLSLRRGDRIIDGRLATYGQNMLGSVEPAPTEAGTALSGNGGGRTNTAVNSNRFVLLTPATTTFDGPTSQLSSAGGSDRKKAWSFGVGWEIGGGGSADPERATDLRNQYFGPFSERMAVVGW